MAVADNFDKLTDTQFLADAGAAFGSYMTVELIENMVAGSGIPGEQYAEYGVFGVAGVVLAEFAPISGRMKRHVQVGAALSAINTAAARFGVKGAVTEAL